MYWLDSIAEWKWREVNAYEDRLLEIIQSEQQRDKWLKKWKEPNGSVGENQKFYHLRYSVSEGEERVDCRKKMFEVTMAENSSILAKDTNLQIQAAQWNSNIINPEKSMLGGSKLERLFATLVLCFELWCSLIAHSKKMWSMAFSAKSSPLISKLLLWVLFQNGSIRRKLSVLSLVLGWRDYYPFSYCVWNVWRFMSRTYATG